MLQAWFRLLASAVWIGAVFGVAPAKNDFLMALLLGVSTGWQTPFVAKLSRPNPPFEVVKEDISWVASLVYISRVFGITFGTIVTWRLGVKRSTYTSGLFTLIGCLFLIWADSIKLVFLYLIFTGIGMGVFLNSFPIYIGEISDPSIRGRLVSFVVQGAITGAVIGNAIGVYLEPWAYGVIKLSICLPFCLTFYFFPPTPHYLIRCDRKEESVKSIKWYNRDIDARKEVERISKFFLSNPPLSLSKTFSKINTPVNRNTLFLMIVIFTLEKLSGILTINVYMEVLFAKSKVTVTTPATMVIIMAVISVLASWLSVYISDKFQRTTTILVASILIALAIFSWGVDFHLLDSGYTEPNLQWIAIIASSVYRICACMSIIPIMHVMMSELFAADVKSMAVCIVNIFCCISGFLSNKYFQFMVDHLGYKYVFYIFAGFALFMGIYCKILVPETKGKNLEEIQEMLNKKKNQEELEELRVS